MSDRDSSVNGDKSKVIGLAGLSSIVKGVKATGRKVAHRPDSSKHASDVKDKDGGPKRPLAENVDKSSSSAPVTPQASVASVKKKKK